MIVSSRLGDCNLRCLTLGICAGARKFPVMEILGARSSTIMIIALIVCAWDKVNPFGNRYPLAL